MGMEHLIVGFVVGIIVALVVRQLMFTVFSPWETYNEMAEQATILSAVSEQMTDERNKAVAELRAELERQAGVTASLTELHEQEMADLRRKNELLAKTEAEAMAAADRLSEQVRTLRILNNTQADTIKQATNPKPKPPRRGKQ